MRRVALAGVFVARQVEGPIIRLYVRDNQFVKKGELLFEIVPAMRAKGVSLANSTPVVNIGLPDRLIDPDSTGTNGEGEASGAAEG